MSEVRKGTSRNTENENKRCNIFNKVLNMNWDYVRGKKTKRKIKINKQKGNKQKKINRKKYKKILYDSLVLYLTKKMVKIRNIFVIQLSDRIYNVTLYTLSDS
jgi:hypothetical protein